MLVDDRLPGVLQATFWPAPRTPPTGASRCGASTRELAGALGMSPADVRAGLAPHLRAGTVRRTGHPRATHYQA